MTRTLPPRCDHDGCAGPPLAQLVDLAGHSAVLCRRHCREALEVAVFAAPPLSGMELVGVTSVALPIILTRWDDASWVSESA